MEDKHANTKRLSGDQIRVSAEQLRSLFKSIPIPAYAWQRKGDDFILIDYNDTARLFTNDKITTLLSVKASELYQDEPQIVIEMRRCLQEQSTITHEMDFNLKSSGARKHLNVKYVFVPPDLVIVLTEDLTKRKKLEEELRLTTSQLQSTFESIGDLVTVQDRNLRVVMSNWHGREYVAEEERRSKPYCYVCYMRQDRPCEKCPAQEVFRTGQPVTMEVKNLYSNRILEVTAYPITDTSGNVDLVTEYVKDITERKKAEDSVRKSEEKFSTIFRSSPIIMTIATEDGQYIDINDAFLKETGLRRDDVIGCYSTDLGIWNSDVRHISMSPVFTDGHIRNNEVQINLPSGEKRDVLLSSELIEIDGVRCSLNQIVDITERKRTEATLRESEEKWRSLVYSVPDYIALIDSQGKYIFLNHFAKGFSEKDVIGKSAFEFLSTESTDLYKKKLDECLTTGLPQKFEYSAVGDNGALRDYEQTFVRTSNINHEMVAMAIAADITERRQSEAQILNLATFPDSNPNPITELSAEGDILYLNPEAWAMFPELKGQGLLHPYLAEWQVIAGKLKNGKTKQIERDIRVGDFYLEQSIHYLPNIDVFRIYGRDITKRKLAEDALRESEERFRSLYENSTIGIYRTTPDGHILLANPALVKMLRYSSFEQLASKTLETDSFEPSYARSLFIDTIEKTGEISGLEYIWKRRDGSLLFVRENARAIRDLNGKTLYYDGTIEDITERKQAEERLKQKEAELDLALRSAQMGVWQWDIVAGKRIFDDQTCTLLGLNPTVFSGTAGEFYSAVHPDDRERIKAALTRTVAQDVLYDPEYRVLWRDGTIHCISARGRLVRDKEGQPLKVNGIIWDITARKKDEEELLSKTAFLEAQINSSVDGIIVVDNMGRNIFENKRSRELWGIPSEILANTDSSVRLSFIMQKVNNPEQFREQIQHLLTHPDESVCDEIQLKNGTILERFSSPVLSKDGKYFGRIWTFHDITERRRTENENLKLREKAEISSRLAAVGEMAAGIAHEINNPLTGVIGFSELLSERKDLPADVKEELKIISDGSNRVKEIVKRLLTFARQTKPVKSSANLNDLIEATLDLRSYVLRTANIEVVKRLDPDLPWTTVDSGQIQQAFLNMIVNAEWSMKKAHGKGTLTVTTQKYDDHIRISIKDDGLGISQTDKEKLFNPFFTTKAEGEGTGLGLSLSRSIILEHGGTIEVESEIDKGATFIITLPVTPITDEVEAQKSAVESNTSPENFRSARILVVDDEEAIRKLISTILGNRGHTVETTGDAREALVKLDSSIYDAVLVDIRMPRMSGMELYYAVKPKRPELAGRFIFITGDTSDQSTREFLEKNELSYITKPFDRETLTQKVNDIL